MTLMPERTAEERDKINAYLLANIAIACIESPETGPKNHIPLNNVYRMIESYRTGSLNFPDFGSPRVYGVLEKAAKEAFPNLDREKVAKEIELVLKGVAYPDRFDIPQKSKRGISLKFFRHVANELS